MIYRTKLRSTLISAAEALHKSVSGRIQDLYIKVSISVLSDCMKIFKENSGQENINKAKEFIDKILSQHSFKRI